MLDYYTAYFILLILRRLDYRIEDALVELWHSVTSKRSGRKLLLCVIHEALVRWGCDSS